MQYLPNSSSTHNANKKPAAQFMNLLILFNVKRNLFKVDIFSVVLEVWKTKISIPIVQLYGYEDVRMHKHTHTYISLRTFDLGPWNVETFYILQILPVKINCFFFFFNRSLKQNYIKSNHPTWCDNCSITKNSLRLNPSKILS